MGPSRCNFALWASISIAWHAVLLYLCLTPAPPQVEGALGWDKLQHASAFGLLAFFIFQACKAHNVTLSKSCLFALLAATAFGGLIELLQGGLTANRQAEWSDLLADATGALVVILSSFIFFRDRG